MKYALIGCGRISANHIAAAQMNDLDVVALCDIDFQKAQSMKEKFFGENNKTKVYTDYKDMLSKEEVDLVAIATESGRHAEIAKYVISRRCNVIIEKPIALSLKDADEIIALAEEHNVKVCTCHQNRFNKSIQKIRKALEEEKFGRLYYGAASIRWNRGQEYYEQAKWRGTWAQDGGALMNQCIHNIDLLRWMMGEDIEEVVGVTDRLKHDCIEAEDLGIAIVRFRNGAYGIIEGTTNIYPRNLEETLCIFGEKGTVKVGGKSVNRIEEWLFLDDDSDANDIKKSFSEEPPNIYGYGHKPLYADMIEAICQDRKPYVDAVSGRKALELVLAIYKASKTGEKVIFPLKDCSTLEFRQMFDERI